MEEKAKPIPNLTLRPFNLSDVDDLMTWSSDDQVMRFLRRGPCTSKEESVDYITNYIMPHPWYRAICIGGRPVGAINVRPLEPDDECRRRAAVGYRLAYDYWGRGIAAAAVKMAVSVVFKEWPHLERLEGLVDVENRRSQRVLEKAGFQREGVLRKYVMVKEKSSDMVMYSFLSTDPFVE